MARTTAPGYKHAMRAAFFILMAMLASSAAAAEALRLPPAGQPQAGKTLPLDGGSKAATANSCASYGRGFHWIESTGSCVKIGGSVSVDTTIRR